ncbi:16S rRNA (guanine(527)-N(7))-methyltransferase RsmG [Falsirhodobacter sp. alg1]|uniref:16S rRNA (guanine(527)-N(7))-methyltransferase RsmG n=1 Tax=Falsirhodobacter sp. alg1 TaxID=1472418 RepID=UPI001EDC31E3|nr:16S rRNA (guanine(527)-N(7))-methyltransferase RsmG [Falsirhodobacter sp. alg1]
MRVSRETTIRLEGFAKQLLRWNGAINLIAKSTESNVWDRHILDSLQVFDLAEAGAHWVDLGSGGGLPGMVVAICAAELRPDLCFTFVESDKRKCTFLREAAREAQIKVNVISERIEAIEPLRADILSARALANLAVLCEYSELHRKPSGQSLFLKGAKHDAEIADAQKMWHFEPVIHPSSTDPSAVIVEIGSISRV